VWRGTSVFNLKRWLGALIFAQEQARTHAHRVELVRPRQLPRGEEYSKNFGFGGREAALGVGVGGVDSARFGEGKWEWLGWVGKQDNGAEFDRTRLNQAPWLKHECVRRPEQFEPSHRPAGAGYLASLQMYL
jgi:hypothetical protein